MILSPKSVPIYQSIANGISKVKWKAPPRNIFIAKKDFDPRVSIATKKFVTHISQTYDVNVFLEERIKRELGLDNAFAVNETALNENIDLVVTLGGDGTILRAVSLFMNKKQELPPVLSFSLGTLGFLLPYDIHEAPSAFDDVYHGRAMAMKRSRLSISPVLGGSTTLHAMNDLTIHRGSSPHLTYIDIKVNDDLVTTAIGDGLTIATPTGSTAYSLSAGGAIVHPSVPCVLVTPICPRSLSFRPLIFPESAAISIAMGTQARGPSELSVDGISMGQLEGGDVLHVQSDPGDGIWCLTRRGDDWVQNLNALLGFNSKFGKIADD